MNEVQPELPMRWALNGCAGNITEGRFCQPLSQLIELLVRERHMEYAIAPVHREWCQVLVSIRFLVVTADNDQDVDVRILDVLRETIHRSLATVPSFLHHL